MFIASDELDIMMFTEVIPKAQRNPIAHAQLTIKGYEINTNFLFIDHFSLQQIGQFKSIT